LIMNHADKLKSNDLFRIKEALTVAPRLYCNVVSVKIVMVRRSRYKCCDDRC